MTPDKLKQARKQIASMGGYAVWEKLTPAQKTRKARRMLKARWEKYRAAKKQGV
jgi:hypothetical protein